MFGFPLVMLKETLKGSSTLTSDGASEITKVKLGLVKGVSSWAKTLIGKSKIKIRLSNINTKKCNKN